MLQRGWETDAAPGPLSVPTQQQVLVKASRPAKIPPISLPLREALRKPTTAFLGRWTFGVLSLAK